MDSVGAQKKSTKCTVFRCKDTSRFEKKNRNFENLCNFKWVGLVKPNKSYITNIMFSINNSKFIVTSVFCKQTYKLHYLFLLQQIFHLFP
jgi:hypothetical protein